MLPMIVSLVTVAFLLIMLRWGGHVEIDDYAIIGGMTAIHQFCVIGAHVMVGGCSGITQDVPPLSSLKGIMRRHLGLILKV